MKLRLRRLESKQTTTVDLPDPCDLDHLKAVVAHLISTISSPASLPTVHLSLNKKDELRSQSPQDSLLDLHLTSGDLLFYTLNPLAFSPNTSSDLLIENTREAKASEIDARIGTRSGHGVESEKTFSYFHAESMKLEDHAGFTEGNVSKMVQKCTESMEETLQHDSYLHWKMLSVPYFLRRVLLKEKDEYDDHMLMVIAVHAVFLEAGFVGYDPVTSTVVQGLPLLENYMCSTLSYTLAEIPISNVVESVRVKFQKLGRFNNIYGSTGRNPSGLCKICLDEHIFVPIFKFVRRCCVPAIGDNIPTINFYPSQDKKLFEFWRTVKDGLTLPLLIDICEMTGLEPPPCLIRLPSELKHKILELLRGIDIAKMELVCSEFRYLSMDDDLWKQKFSEEFGNTMNEDKCVKWKWKYASSFKNTKCTTTTSPLTFPISRRVGPMPLMIPGILGGDYDRFPSMGVGGVGMYNPPLPSHFPPFRQSNGRRNIIPPCFHSTFDT